MEIRQKGYSRWQGEFAPSRRHWLPITRNGIRSVFKKKYAKLVFSLCASTFLVFLVAVYASTKPELKILGELVRLLRSDAELFKTFYSNGFLTFMLVILSVFAGADLVASDLKSKAFPLYFARPLSRLDYLAGKLGILLFYLLAFTLLPGILLLLFKMLFSGSLAIAPNVLLAIVAFPLVASACLAALTLALSSLSPNVKFVQIAIFLVYIFSNNLAHVLRAIFKSDYAFLVSLPGNIQQLGAFLFGLKPAYNFPAWLSLLLPLALCALSLWLLAWRIRKAEASA
jgi:ABC-2 type transport system permease protein